MQNLMVVGFIVDEILRVGFKNDKVTTVYQRTPDIAIDLSRKLGRGALRGQYFSVFFV